MDKNQEITFQLLKEIDEICKENKITYYLHADTAAMALKEGKYVDNYLSTAVEMTTQNARKFMNAIEEKPREKRALEHMGNYEGYAGFSMKYVNTDTMYVPLNFFDNYEQKGIGIQIYFIRGRISNKWKQKLWTLFEFGLEQNDFFVKRKPGKREFVGKYIVKFLQVFWKKASMKKYFFNKWLKDYEYTGEGKAFVRKAFAKRHEYPQRYFEEERHIEFEGYNFPVIWDTAAHVRCWRGKNWSKNFKGVKPGRELLVDSRIPFGEFIDYLEKENVSFEKVKAHHKILKKQILKRSSLAKNKKLYWRYAWNVRKNYLSDKMYEEKKEYIQNLYEDGAYLEVLDALKYYNMVIRENIKFQNSRTGNEKILWIYKIMLQMQGQEKLLNELNKWEKG